MFRKTLLRSAVAFVGLVAIPVMTTVLSSGPAAAANPQLTKADEIAIRGTIVAIDPTTRTVVVDSPERDTLSYKALDRVTNFSGLKTDMLVDVRYYRIVDYVVAKTTPEVTSQVNALLSDPAKAPGIPDTQMRAKLWSVSGMVVRTIPSANKVDVVDPNGGAVYRTPWIKSAEGQAALKTFKPGDHVTFVFSTRSAFEITPVR